MATKKRLEAFASIGRISERERLDSGLAEVEKTKLSAHEHTIETIAKAETLTEERVREIVREEIKELEKVAYMRAVEKTKA